MRDVRASDNKSHTTDKRFYLRMGTGEECFRSISYKTVHNNL